MGVVSKSGSVHLALHATLCLQIDEQNGRANHYAADKLMLLYCSMTPMDNANGIKTVVSIYNVPIYRYRYIILDTCVFRVHVYTYY